MLGEATAALGSGLAIAIAPEGTRSAHDTIGHFKKGGFRIAQAAGVPLVPIVIRDAGLILPRGGFIMRAGVVRVTVLEPRPTDSWPTAGLDGPITEIEEAYRQTLRAGWSESS